MLGIGFAATRDMNSFLRYDDKDEHGTPTRSPSSIRWVISRGIRNPATSSARFIHLGFNQDEAGRIVWDGANPPHCRAASLRMNFRFAVRRGSAPDCMSPAARASSGGAIMPISAPSPHGRPARPLHAQPTPARRSWRLSAALEFWNLRESPDLVGTDAKADIPLPPNVRRYFFPGTTHGGGRGGFITARRAAECCVLPANPNPELETMQALTAALIDWVTKGTEPPPSRYPRLDRGQLAPAEEAAPVSLKFPARLRQTDLVNPLADYDFGPEFNYDDVSGIITKEPPVIKQWIPTLVPKVDADGSDVGGVPSVLRQAPLGSYLGWNPTAGGFDKGKQCTLSGGYIPFARTKAERTAKGDPRLSLEERYKDHAGYVAAVKAAAEKAVSEGFLLRDDAGRLIAQATASDVLANQ